MTTAQQIIDAAIATSLANDAGQSELANDTTELLNVLNRKLAQVYTLAGMPRDVGGAGRGDFFATVAQVTLAATAVALPAAAFRHLITRNSDGKRVRVATRADLLDGVAEIPPAVVIEQQKIISAGRAGDPVAGDVLNVFYTPLPDLLTAGSDFIGATPRTDASTTQWPRIGDAYLVCFLALYLARKAADRDPAEIESLGAELGEASRILGTLIGVEATRLAADEGEPS